MVFWEESIIKLKNNKIKHYIGDEDYMPLENVDFSEQLWVQVDRWKIKTSSWVPVTAKRVMLKLMPYAMYAESVGQDSITSYNIQDGSITVPDLDDGAALWEILDDDGAGTGLDADLLDGRESSTFADSGHDHDGRYYQQAQLYTTTEVDTMISGLDSRYQMSAPLQVPRDNAISTVDSAGNVGRFSSITIGSDGLPVISYYDSTNNDLKAAKAANPFFIPYWTRR